MGGILNYGICESALSIKAVSEEMLISSASSRLMTPIPVPREFHRKTGTVSNVSGKSNNSLAEKCLASQALSCCTWER